jgi:outer membrane protein assembly factor BamB
MPEFESTRSLGPANYQARVQAGALLDDTVFAVTFRQEPVHLVAYDPAARQVTDAWEVPVAEYSDSPGAWNVVAYDDRYLYTVMQSPAEMFRFDRATETFDRVARLPDAADSVSGCKGIDVRGGRLFFATKNEPVLYEFDHGTDELREIGPPRPGAWKAHDLAIGEEWIYVGGGTGAYVSAVHPETGEHRDLLPPALADENFVQSVAVTPGERVVAGTSDRLAVIDPEAPPSEATVVAADPGEESGAITSLFATDEVAYFTTCDPTYALWAYEFGTDEPSRVAAPIGHPTRTIVPYDGGLLGVGSGGYSAVWTCDPETGETTRTSLGDVGLPRGAGNVQSLLAMDGDVYAGGSRVTGVHGVDSGDFEQFPTPGEPKVMRALDGRVYQAVYGGAGIVEYDPETGESRELAWIGEEQNRPRSMHYHDLTGHLLVGTRPKKGLLGGAISAYDLDADELVSVDRDVVPDQSVTGLASIGGTVFLSTEIYGGFGTDPVASRARVAAWDPVAREVRWEATPFDDAETIRGLTALDGTLYGQATGGRLFGLDPGTREVVVERSFGEGLEREGEGRENHYREMATGDLRVHGGRVYGVDARRLFVFDPEDGELDVLCDDLAGAEGWHNFPQLAIDDGGRIYVADGKDLLGVAP